MSKCKTITCPNCKNRLPWIWGDKQYYQIEIGDWVECGMCPHIWQFKPEEVNTETESGMDSDACRDWESVLI